MKGKVLSIITAVLFGATMVASPILNAAPTDETTGAAGMEEQAPAKKKPAKKKKAAKKVVKKKVVKKKVAKKKAAKKKTSKKKKPAEQPAEQPE
ncbi:MAG: hypothetical protein ABSG91_04690 [Syntrophobacteraceae bacterium]|jgi:outer membrane biosynthesis protein TonB